MIETLAHAFKLRFFAEILDECARLKERDGARPDEVAEDKQRAAKLRRQAFKIEETGHM
ncbi:hypothetical protein [Asticcacaulis machinosus]|uniref:Uncharacterized protein n=1 Tax=Asticcacaulis machinosus TaxID=2984211 RepID=A0ABT5HHG9_9CAUL|nr:hypothetical protein [Asticcacaulis machinosus]MDC7675566.1 hypothetical protein [Asticcacaulis machinosus]